MDLNAEKKLQKNESIYKCFIIGETTLTVECMKVLLKRNHILLGVYTDDDNVKNWCFHNSIRVLETKDLKDDSYIRNEKHDFIFSIYSVTVLSKDIIKLPGEGIINFHDSLLPKYAGMYVPSWAVINEETEYGVSWHWLEEKIDAGDILKQQKIVIEKDETAFSLHMKCYDSALSSFKELILELETGSQRSLKQCPENRSYYAKYKRPENSSFILFTDSASKIKALINGLNTNTRIIENPLGSPKIKIKDKYYIVKNVKVMNDLSGEKPGLILKQNENSFIVSTGTNNLEIKQLITMLGEKINLTELINQFEIREREFLNIPDKDLEYISKFNKEICRYEELWVNRLYAFEPLCIDLPYVANEKSDRESFSIEEINLSCDNSELSKYENHKLIFTMICIYLSKVTNNTSFDICYCDDKLLNQIRGYEQLFSDRLPFKIEIGNTDDFISLYNQIEGKIKRLSNQGTYFVDVINRYPKLVNRMMAPAFSFAINLTLLDKFDDYNIYRDSGNILDFIIAKDKNSLIIKFNKQYLNKDDVDLLANEIVKFNKKIVGKASTELNRILYKSKINFLSKVINEANTGELIVNVDKLKNCLILNDQINLVEIILHPDNNYKKILVCCVVSDNELFEDKLSDYVRNNWAIESLPISFMQLENIPSHRSGNTNIKLLQSIVFSNIKTIDRILPQSSLEKKIYNIWHELLKIKEISVFDNFFDVGGNSLLVIRLISKLKMNLGIDVSVTTIFQYPSIRKLAEYISKKQEDKEKPSNEKKETIKKSSYIENRSGRNEIAIIGMAGKFPGAENIYEYWDNLKKGKESITSFTDEELYDAGIEKYLVQNPNYIKVKGFLPGVEYFDADFFGYTPKEAQIMDPQIRLMHEYAWKALEDAGYNADDYNGDIGLFVGSSNNFHWLSKVVDSLSGEVSAFQANMLNDRDFLSTHVSYKLNLKGPSVTIQTACSTSLVAVDTAISCIINNKCDIALAGGVSITYPLKAGYLYQDGMINSPDGHCRAFDIDAKGTLLGNGIGLVVLKKLDDAIKNGDNIYAVIKGSAINNDGSSKIGYTAPGVNGQINVIREAQQMAGVSPESINYIETHGTGTILGDPIEIEALSRAFDTDKKGYCSIGSVKTNIGHLDAAAGVASLIKTALSIKNLQIPKSLNFTKPNPKIDFKNSPFYVNEKLVDWDNSNQPARAGVSSFGIGGTNAHLILEEAPKRNCNRKDLDYNVILLSGKEEETIKFLNKHLLRHLKNNKNIHLDDIAYTLQVGRKHFNNRQYFVVSNLERTTELLEVYLSDDSAMLKNRNVFTSRVDDRDKCIVFMFSGIGSQYINMGKGLYDKYPFFKKTLENCFSIINKISDKIIDYKKILFSKKNDRDLFDFEIAQIVIFCFEYSLAQLLIHLNIKPNVIIGYSFGEYLAACISGVFSLEDVLNIITFRGRLINGTEKGAMLSIPLPVSDVRKWLNDDLSIAINNGDSCVIAGSIDKIEILNKEFKSKRIITQLLNTSYAIHSTMMHSIKSKFIKEMQNIKSRAPEIPFISNVTGTWITTEQATSAHYWFDHLSKTVEFSAGLETLNEIDSKIFIEIGPGNDLTQLLTRMKDSKNTRGIVNIIKPSTRDVADTNYFMNKIGELWSAGVDIDWEKIYDYQPYRISLPSYPFVKKQFSLNAGKKKNKTAKESKWFLGKNKNIDDWFYSQSWERSDLIYNPNDKYAGDWLVFLNDSELCGFIVDKLEDLDFKIIKVWKGSKYEQINKNEYTVRSNEKYDYGKLIQSLKRNVATPGGILHLWNLDNNTDDSIEYKSLHSYIDTTFYSLIYLVQALGDEGVTNDLILKVVSNNMQKVIGDDLLYPQKSNLLGPVKIIPLEYFNIKCFSIDIDSRLDLSGNNTGYLNILVNEILSNSKDNIVSIRGNYRWLPTIKKIKLLQKDDNYSKLKHKGVYLITGGFGGMGSSIAKYLAKNYCAKLILIGRSKIPKRSRWNKFLNSETSDYDEKTANNILKVKELESYGSEVTAVSANISEYDLIDGVINNTIKQYGKLNGVFHTAGKAEYDGIIQNKTKKKMFEILEPKVLGTVLLNELCKDLDFFFICSSLAPVIYQTKVGQVAYCSANEFIDFFVGYLSSNSNSNVYSVNWADWKNVGMSVESAKHWGSKLNLLDSQSILEEGILPEEGVEVITRILNNSIAQVMVSPEDLIYRTTMYKEHEKNLLENILFEAKTSSNEHFRPKLTASYEAPSDVTEVGLCEIWQEVFGIEKIGVNDDFYELGGDSLKAIILISRIHKELNIRVSLKEFYKYYTIRELKNIILGKKTNKFIEIQLTTDATYYRLSSAQQRLYVVNSLDPNSLNYNMFMSWELKGYLNVDKLKAAFDKVFERHESLRTSFVIKDDIPFQIINETVEYDIVKYTTLNEDFPHIIKEFVQPFDLAKAPLIRIGYIKVEEDIYILLIDIHHIISDGISNNNIITDLAKYYNNIELAPLRIQYKDYADWEQDRLKSQKHKEDETYWINYLQDYSPLDLLTDFERPAIKVEDGLVEEITIDAKLTEKIKSFAKKENVTVFSLLLSFFYIVLSKLSGQEDIIVGVPVAARLNSDLDNLVGMFVNTIVLRGYPVGDIPFSVFLKNVNDNNTEAFEHQDYPFEKLVEKLEFDRDVSRNPIFDVMFSMQNMAFPNITLDSLSFSYYPVEKTSTQFDLSLDVILNEREFKLNFEYCTKILKMNTAKRIIAYYINLLSIILNNSDILIKDINLLTKDDKNRYKKLNHNGKIFDEAKTLPEMFHDQVLKTPGLTALYYEHIEMTYLELNLRTNQIARQLMEIGVGRNTIVAIIADPSIEMIMGILGIIKSGGAYLPIEKDTPNEKLFYMLRDSAVEILLTQKCLSKDLKEILSDYPVKMISIDDPETGKYDNNDLELINRIDDLAYVIYTSGTTGKPKGVLCTHGNITNYCRWFIKTYNLDRGIRNILLTKFTFDPSVSDIFSTISSGSTLYIPPKFLRLDVSRLRNYIDENQIELINELPSVAKEVLCDQEKLESISTVILGGEKLPQSLNDYLLEVGYNVYNHYGPTETTIDTLVSKCKIGRVEIGRPIWNAQAYVIDKYGSLVLPGVSGELCISGKGVTKGYLNNPDLTSKSYIQNVIGNGKMYKTGDLVRMNEEQNLEFYGRIDSQVKINGIRVELEEIESIMKLYPNIKETVVIDRKNENNELYLSAYYITENNCTIDHDSIIEFVSQYLIKSVIPQCFIRLDKFPLTANGKLDKKSLPKPEKKIRIEAIEPRNEIESYVSDIWKNLLMSDVIDVHDNFFQIGGTSMTIIKMKSILEKRFPNINIIDLFKYKTISNLANFLAKSVNKENISIKIRSVSIAEEYILNDIENIDVELDNYDIEINDAHMDKLKKITNKTGIKIIDIILALYIYLIFEISDIDTIIIQLMIDSKRNIVKSVSLDLKNINTIDELFSFINTTLVKNNYDFEYDLQDFEKIRFNKKRNDISPLIYYRKNYSLPFDLTRKFDLAMEVGSDRNEGMILSIKYNESKINSRGIKKLSTRYAELLSQLLRQE